MTVINFRNAVTALVLACAVTTPALAQSRDNQPGHAVRAQTIQNQDGRSNNRATATRRANRPGHAARAQAIPEQDGMPNDRATAIRECNGKANSFTQTTWGMTQSAMYRTCMMERGFME